MGKSITEKLQEIMEVFAEMGKENPVFGEIEEISEKLEAIIRQVSEKKFSLTDAVYKTIDELYEKYRHNMKVINRQKDIIKDNMKKLEKIYEDDIKKKIKDVENFTVTKKSFDIAGSALEHYKNSIDQFNQISDVFIETMKELKSEYSAGKKTEKKENASGKTGTTHKKQPGV